MKRLRVSGYSIVGALTATALGILLMTGTGVAAQETVPSKAAADPTGESRVVTGADAAFRLGLGNAFRSSKLLDGLDLDNLERSGRRRTLDLGDKGELIFFRMPRDGIDEVQDSETPPGNAPSSVQDNAAVSAAVPQPGAPAPAPTTPVTQKSLDQPLSTTDTGKPTAASVPGELEQSPTGSTLHGPDPLEGRYFAFHELETMQLSRFTSQKGKAIGIDLKLRDVVFLFSSEAHKERLSKLAVPPKTSKYLRDFLPDRRHIDLPAGGMFFARLVVKETPYFDKLDGALNFKEDEILVQGSVGPRMLRRVLGLNTESATPDIGRNDLDLQMSLEGFRPRKIGRYIDAQEMKFTLRGDESGKLVLKADARARFGIGARKVKVPAAVRLDPNAEGSEAVFHLTASAGKDDLKGIEVGNRKVRELSFEFSLNQAFEPKLRAEGKAGDGADEIPISGELDEEDGRDLFALDGSTLEALTGLDIPGLDEIRFPNPPRLNTGRAVTLETQIRGKPASVVIGPITNDEAAYVALSMEGGLESLLPDSALGDVGNLGTGGSVFLYLPKGRAPPALSALPAGMREKFINGFDADDLRAAKPGLNLFQASRFDKRHPFSQAMNVFRSGGATGGDIQIVGRLNPLIFDEPEDGIKETWSAGNGRETLKTVLNGMHVEGRVAGLDGLGVGSFFRLADRASFEFAHNAGTLTTTLKFGGALTLSGRQAPRRFEFLATQASSGRFNWQGVEVDDEGADLAGGQRIQIEGRFANNRPEDIRVWLQGRYRLGDIFATQVNGLSDLEVQNVALSRGYLTAALGTGREASALTVVDKGDVRLAVVTIDGDVKPARYIPGLDKTPFADLRLPSSIAVIAGPDVDRNAVQALPNDMGKTLLAAMDAAGIEPASGITYLSRITFDGIDPLSGLVRRLGVPANDEALLHGRIPASVISAIAGQGRIRSVDMAGLDLSAKLPRLALPGIGELFALTDASTLNLAVDDSGTPRIAVRSKGTFTMPIVNTSEDVTLTADIFGSGSDREVLLEVTSATLNEQGEPKLKIYAAAPLALNALNTLQGFVASVENGMSLSDVLGRDVPGIGALTLTDAKLSLGHVAGTLALGDTRLKANIAVAGGGARLPVLTLEALGLPSAAMIPGINKSPLADITLDRGLLTYVPPLPGGGSDGIKIADLPDVMQAIFRRGEAGGDLAEPDLRPGLNLVSSLDPNKLGPLTRVLEKLKSRGGGTKLTLNARMPGDALTFVGEKLTALKVKLTGKKSKPPLKDRIKAAAAKGAGKAKVVASKTPAKAKALAANLLPKIIKQVKVVIPVPGISLPGIGDYLASNGAEIRIDGYEYPETKVVGLRTVVASDLVFAVPGLPISGTAASELLVDLDSAKNVRLTLAGTGELDNVDAQMALAGSFDVLARVPDLQISVVGNGLTLGALTGLRVPGVTELALNHATVKAGELSGEIELKGARTRVAAFGFTRTQRPLLALASENVDAAQIIPGVEGSILDAAVLDKARFLYVPAGREDKLSETSIPQIFAGALDPATIQTGFNTELRISPKAGTRLWELVNGIGVKLQGPIEIEGHLPANLFAGPRHEILRDVRLAATLPKISFDRIAAVRLEFKNAPRLKLEGGENGLSSTVETGLAVTLPTIDRRYEGEGTFTAVLREGGGHQLRMLAITRDPEGRTASIEATMELPGSPRDFRLKFAGEQTLSSLLGVDIPVIGDINLSELEKGESFLVAKIKLKALESTVAAFRNDGRWAVVMSAGGLKPSEFIPGLDNLPFKNFTLPDAMFVFVPPKLGGGAGQQLPFDIADLPDAVRTGLDGVLAPFGGHGGTTLRGGLNLVSLIDPSKVPGLAKALKFTGSSGSGRTYKLSGLLPTQSLKSLTSGASAFAGLGKEAISVLLRGVDLDTDLPAVNLPGVRDVVTFGNPHLQIKGSDTDGELKLVMGIAGDMAVSLPNVPVLDLAGKISFVAAGDGLALDVSGTGTPNGRNVTVGGQVNLSKQNPMLQLSFTTDVTVADLIGGTLPGIADLALIDARFGSEIISGTMQYRGAKTTLAAFDYRNDRKPFVALLSENVDAANFIPGVGGSPLDNARLAAGALVYVPAGKSAYPRSDNFPERLTRAISFVSREYTVDPAPGLKAGFDVTFKEGAPLANALAFVGYKGDGIKLVGALPTDLLNSRNGSGGISASGVHRAAGRVTNLAGDALKSAIKGVDLEARLPAINIPGVDQVVRFGDPLLRIRGGDVLNPSGEPTGEVKLRVGVDGDMVLKLPGHDLAFDGGFDIEKTGGGKAFKLLLYSTSRLNWNQAFGLPFLELKELSMAGAIERKADGSARLAASLASKLKLDNLTFNSTAAVGITSSGLPEVRFTVDNKVRMGDLPGLGSVPGINEVAFSNLWVGTGGLGGRAEIDKLGIGGEANLFLHGGKPVLLVKADRLSLRNLLPKSDLNQMWDNLLGLSFPDSIFALSTVDLTRTKIASLPAAVQPMLSGFGGSSGEVGIKDGVSLMAALTEDSLPSALKPLVTKNMNIFDPSLNGGIDGPLMLSGSLSGVFTGALKARLAVRLPQLKLPKPSNDRQWARMVKLDGVGGEGFIEIDVPNTAFWLGARGNLSVDVPHIDDPTKVDELRFAGDLIAGFDLVSWAGAFKIAGHMDGTWRKPMGLNENYSLKNPAILVGVDSEGSVEFGIGASVLMTGLRGGRSTLNGDVDFLININFSTSIPLPKKLAVGYRLEGEVWPLTFIEVHEAMLKGILTGPMANVILETPGMRADAKANLKSLQEKVRKFSILDALQIDKLPLPYVTLQDPVIYLATPGAKIPGREETLDTAGIRLGGVLNMDFMGEKKRMGGADFRLTLTDGLIAKADIADVALPPVLTLTNTKLDVVANLKQLPHFKMSGYMNILGAREAIDVEMSKDRIEFNFERDLGRLVKTRFVARTDSGDLLKARDFIVTAEVQSELDDLLTKEVFPRMGIPPVVADILKKQTPLYIHGARFKGKLREFLEAKTPVRLELDHSFFGTRMAEPAVAEVMPAWASTDPTKVFPAVAIAAAMTKSFFEYVKRNPIELGRVNLGLMTIDNASLSAATDGSNRFKLDGKLSALGLPFSETSVILDDNTGITVDSWTEVNFQLPLGPLGNLGKSRTDLHYELNPVGLSHAIDLKVSTAALGFEDHIYFNFRGDMNATRVEFYSDNPCAKFRSSSELGPGDLRNFAFKAQQGKVTPIDVIKLINFQPSISLPTPADAVKCGGRVIALAGNVIDVVDQGLKEIDKASKDVIKFAGNIANEIFKGLAKLAGCLSKHGCAHDFKPGQVILRNFTSHNGTKNMCADLRNQSSRPDTEILSYPCHMRWNQAFTLESNGTIKSITRDEHMCLGARSYRVGGQVGLVKCWWSDVLLKFDFLATGAVRAKLDGRRDLCLATDRGKVVLWTCNDPRKGTTDKWAAYEPASKSFKNPAGERDAQMMRAALKAPISNEKAVPFYRFETPGNREQRHTWNGRGYAESSEWRLDDRLGLIFKGRARGTVPLYIYERRGNGKVQQAFTTDPRKFSGGVDGLALEGVAGYVYPNDFPGSIPLHLYEHPSQGDYVLRLEKNLGNWRYHGIAGYAAAPPQPPGDDAPFETSNPEQLSGTDAVVFPKRAENTIALYRYRNPGNGNVLHTTNFAELGAGDPWFEYEGIAGWVYPDARQGTKPIYRYYNKSARRHDVTIDPKKRNAKRGGGGYEFEAIIGHAISDDFGPGKDARVVNTPPQEFMRYFNPSTNDHMYTADPNQLGDGDDGYVRDGVAGGIFRERAKGTQPLYRYWNGTTKDHIYTTRFRDLWYGKDGYEYIGVEGYIYSAAQKGALALHRYVNNRTHDNLLTTDFDEFGGKAGKNGFSYVGVEGWVPPAPTPADTVKTGTEKPVDWLRFRHPGNGDRRLVQALHAADAERGGYRLERPAVSVFRERAKGTVAVYEYFNAGNGDHLYTRDFNELGRGKHGYAYQGIAGWVYPNESKGTVALHRYYNPSSGDHLLSADFDEFGGKAGKDGYVYAGIVGWALPFRAPGADSPVIKTNPGLLVRYHNARTGDHRLTLGTEELGDAADGYVIESIHGRAWPKRATGTVPLYHYFNKERGDHLYTHDFGEYWQGRDGYSYQGILAYVHSQPEGDSIALHRYFSGGNLDTLLTTDFEELNRNAGGNGYQYARIEGYVLPFNPPGTDVRVVKTAPVPLVRYYDRKRGQYALTAGSAIYGIAEGDLKIEQVQGRIYPERAAGTVPLYRYRHVSGAQRVTDDFNEFLFAKGGYEYAGIVGYVHPAEKPNTVPLHRFDHAGRNANVLTTDISEFGGKAGRDGYAYVGIAGWVPEYPDRPVSGFERFYLATNDNFSCLDSDNQPNTILSSQLCKENGDLLFALWADGTIRHNSSKLCLAVSDKSTDRTAVSTLACDYTDAQKWELRWSGRKPSAPNGKSPLQLVHKASGKCLGLQDASAQDGVEADLYPCEKPGRNVQTWLMSNEVPAYVIPGTDAQVVRSEPRWLVRYFNPKRNGGDNVVTPGFEEFGRGRDGYLPARLMARLYETRNEAHMVPLYRYVSEVAGDHMFTTDFAEYRFAGNGYRYEKVAGYVFESEQPGTVALHRFDNKSISDTLLTADFHGWGGNSGRDGYKYVGTVGWTPGTDAQAPAPWDNLHIASRGGMVCLTGDEGSGIASARCLDSDNQKIGFYSDGTIRFGGEKSCLEAGIGDDRSVYAGACDGNLKQRWDVVWQGGKAGSADGKTALQLRHWWSGRCLVLEDGAGVDGIGATMSGCANFAANDRTGTWWAHAAPPAFTPPGMEAPGGPSKLLPLIAYRREGAKGGDHRLAVGPQELGLGKDGYEMIEAVGKIYPKRAAETVPLYRYENITDGDHDFTTDFRRHGWGYGGYVYKGVAGYVHDSKKEDTVALHGFYNDSRKDHLLTSKPDAYGGISGRGGFAYIGIEAWVPRYPEDPTPGLEKLYLSTNGHLSCLDAGDDGGKPGAAKNVISSFCGDHETGQFTFWQDGTLRHDGSGQCVSPDAKGDGLSLQRCAYTPAQQFGIRRPGSATAAVDGKAGLQIVHLESGKCMSLADTSGQDGVTAVLDTCAVSAEDVQTWVAGTDKPAFVAPGMAADIVSVKPEVLIRYVHTKQSNGNHMMQVGPEPYGLGRDGYDMQLAQGWIYPSRTAETVPLYRYLNTTNGDTLYTSDFHEFRYARAGAVYDGIIGYVYPAERAGAVALHRFANTVKGDHVLASNMDEFGGKSGKNGYSYDGIVGWVPKYDEAPANGLSGLYLATNGNLSCLDAEGDAGSAVRSRFCETDGPLTFTSWTDGTFRNDAKGLCLTLRGTVRAGSPVAAERCSYTPDQQWTLNWQDGNPGAANGKTALKLVHRESGLCLTLATGSGQDGVGAFAARCGTSSPDLQAFVVGTEVPVFVPPGMELPLGNAAPLPFIRYHNASAPNGDHLMQVGPEPLGLGRDGYDMQLAQGQVYPSRREDTVPLYRYVDRARGDHIYTSDFHEFRYAKGEAEYDGVIAFVYAKERKGTLTLHRYANAAKGDHLLTTRFDEMGGTGGRDGYRYDGVVGFVPDYPERPQKGFEQLYAATNGNLSCLDAEISDGASVTSSFCEDHKAGQFSIWEDGTIRHYASGLCLSLPLKPKEGVSATVARCAYTDNQQWQIRWAGKAPNAAAGKTAMEFVHRESGLCIGLRDASGQDGIEAAAFKCGDAERGTRVWQLSAKKPVFTPPLTDQPTVKSVPVPFVRYVRNTEGVPDHAMRQDYTEWGTQQGGYVIERPQGLIHPAPAKGTVPLYRYLHADRRQHLYTMDFHEFRYARDGYAYDGAAGYVFARQGQDLVPLHRYDHGGNGDQILSTDFEVLNGRQGRDGYAYTGIAAWVPPYQAKPVAPLQSVFAITKDWMCLASDTDAENGKAHLQPCADRAPWRLTHYDDDTLRFAGGNFCLAVDGQTVTGIVEACVYRSPRQVFDILWNGGKPPKILGGEQAFRVRHADSTRCLTVNGVARPGVRFQLAPCGGTAGRADQNWLPLKMFPEAEPVKPWQFLQIAGGADLCLDAGPAPDGKPVTLAACKQNVRSTFSLFADKTLRHDRSGLCLTVPEGADDRTPLQLTACMIHNSSQGFEIAWIGNGKAPKSPEIAKEFMVQHPRTGLCVRANRGNWREDGTVTLGKCGGRNGRADQNWHFGIVATQ